MAITLDTDPIVDQQTVAEALMLTGHRAVLYINAVSEMFRRYTARSRISQGAVVDRFRAPAPQQPVVFLGATPVASVTSVKTYLYGEEQATLTTDDYTLVDATGRMTFSRSIAGTASPEQVIVASYTGGWVTVPGDVTLTALEMIKLIHSRLSGRIGVVSESREGHSASYSPDAIPQSVQEMWNTYRVMS